jgi:hypothetical protein
MDPIRLDGFSFAELMECLAIAGDIHPTDEGRKFVMRVIIKRAFVLGRKSLYTEIVNQIPELRSKKSQARIKKALELAKESMFVRENPEFTYPLDPK